MSALCVLFLGPPPQVHYLWSPMASWSRMCSALGVLIILIRIKSFVWTSTLSFIISLPFGSDSAGHYDLIFTWNVGFWKTRVMSYSLVLAGCALYSAVFNRMCYNWTKSIVPASCTALSVYLPSFSPVLRGITLDRRLTPHPQSFPPFWMWRPVLILRFFTDSYWLGNNLVICPPNIWKIQRLRKTLCIQSSNSAQCAYVLWDPDLNFVAVWWPPT